MTPCSFQDKAGCKECIYINYKACSKFKKLYIQFLGRELTPFCGVSVKLPEEFIVWSSDERKVKSLALLRAIRLGEPVAKFDLNQIFQIVLHQNEIEFPKVVMLELGKSTIDKEKMSGVVESFIATIFHQMNLFQDLFH